MGEYNFKKYLLDNGYYYSNEILENFMLSLKVKPFLILTGHAGAGKTKLAQLFANYLLKYASNSYYNIKVSTLKRSFTSNGNDKRVGWGIRKKYLEKAIPIDCFNGEYDIEIGGYKTKADFSLVFQLYYDYNNLDLKKYFKDLYEKELKIKEQDKKLNRKHEQQMVDLGVWCDSLKKLISEDYTIQDEIVLYPTVTEDTLKCKDKIIPTDIFNYFPFNRNVPTNIVANGIYSNAKFNLKVRMRNFDTPDIKSYLKKLYDDKEKTFELKIKGFKQDFDEFKNFNSDLFDNAKNYELMPVGSDWNDGSHILGYYNVIKNKYQSTPSFDLIKRANSDLNNPYFLILDEMNASPVEKYLLDILSSIESGEKIPLYGNDDSLVLPRNLFIIGTVNVDENNYKFLPKVLDRSNTIELNSVSASDYMLSDSSEDDFEFDGDYLESFLFNQDVMGMDIHNLKKILTNISCNEGNLLNVLAIELNKFQVVLKNTNFDFNFRVINEILRFMVAAWKYEYSPKKWDNWKRYFDAQIKQRILSKLFGSKKDLCPILIELFNLCIFHSDYIEDLNFNINSNNCIYFRSAIKIQNMFNVLVERDFISFINQV